jgi:DNA adenine methylase
MNNKPLKTIIARVGGKTKVAKKLIEYFPLHSTYVEPFIGGGSVFFMKKEANMNVINDLDKDIYDIYKDICSIDNIEDFQIGEINKDEFKKYLNMKDFKDAKERFYRNLVLSKKSYSGCRVRFSQSTNSRKCTLGYLKKHFEEYKNKLKNTIILNEDYKEVIKKYDSKDTFFFFDPPYSKNDKTWGYNDNSISKEKLLEVLLNLKGKFLMTYDYNEDNMNLFSKYFNIKIHELDYKMSGDHQIVKELIIMNY